MNVDEAVTRALRELHVPVADALDVELEGAALAAAPIRIVNGADTNWDTHTQVVAKLRRIRHRAPTRH